MKDHRDDVGRVDITVIVLGTAWSEAAHGRTLETIQDLMEASGLRAQALLVDLLPQDANLQQLLSEPVARLPRAWQDRLAQEGYDYLCDYGCTARALRRAVRSARGHWVCVLREGDEIGFRRQADRRLMRRDLDILIGVGATADDALAAHRALAGVPPEARGLASLVGLSTAYEGSLIVRRDHLDDVLGQVGYDAEPGYFSYLNEVLTIAALRDVGRVAFTEQLAVFPAPDHQARHRDRVLRYGLPVLPFRRREAGPKHEACTEALVDGVLDRLRDLALARADATPPGRASPAAEWRHVQRGEPTAHTQQLLQWMVAQVFRGWGWHPQGVLPRTGLLPCPTLADVPLPEPTVSLISSAFRGESVAHSFLTNLTSLQGFEDSELLLVCPQPNLVQDLVFGQFAAAEPRIRLVFLDEDPGIYACWNLAIRQARGRYISNANLDDRRDARQLRSLVDLLDRSGADVASAAVAITHALKDITGFDGDLDSLQTARFLETWFGGPGSAPETRVQKDFFHWNDRGEVTQCMNFPHCMPVWRKSVHDRFGEFDEPRHGTYADFALWLTAVSQGARFIHDPTPLGLYHVDPRSHNRRHANQVAWDEIVRKHLPSSVHIHAPVHVRAEARWSARDVSPRPPGTDSARPSFDFGLQLQQYYGTHRSGWSYAMQALEQFHLPGAAVACNTFLEKRFVWGSDPGDGGCGPVDPLRTPWVGFLHVPPQVPAWFQFEQSNEQIFSKQSWQTSRRWCRGLFVLSDYHRRHLESLLRPDFPISVLLHPTEFVEQAFSLDRWRDNADKRLVQVGWWLRKLAAVNYLRTPGMKPTLLGSSDWTKMMVSYAERRYHGLATVPPVESIDFLDNDAYDRLLTENLVFVDFYDTSANNAVIECIARATPIVVCRHPAVEEYLGAGYPLFFDHPDEIPALVRDHGRIAEAHRWLMQPAVREPLTLESFSKAFASSEVARWAHGG